MPSTVLSPLHILIQLELSSHMGKVVTVPSVQMRKLRPWETKEMFWGHTARKWWSSTTNPSGLVPELILLTYLAVTTPSWFSPHCLKLISAIPENIVFQPSQISKKTILSHKHRHSTRNDGKDRRQGLTGEGLLGKRRGVLASLIVWFKNCFSGVLQRHDFQEQSQGAGIIIKAFE